MPEGHTIHRLAREHNRLLVGHPVRASSPQGRFAAGAARIEGALRPPPGRAALPGLRHRGPDGGHGRPEPLLVPYLPAVTYARRVSTSTPG